MFVGLYLLKTNKQNKPQKTKCLYVKAEIGLTMTEPSK